MGISVLDIPAGTTIFLRNEQMALHVSLVLDMWSVNEMRAIGVIMNDQLQAANEMKRDAGPEG